MMPALDITSCHDDAPGLIDELRRMAASDPYPHAYLARCIALVQLWQWSDERMAESMSGGITHYPTGDTSPALVVLWHRLITRAWL